MQQSRRGEDERHRNAERHCKLCASEEATQCNLFWCKCHSVCQRFSLHWKERSSSVWHPLIYLQAICQWHQEVLLQLSCVNRKTWIELRRVLGCQLCDLDGVASTSRQQPIALSSLCFLPVGETALVLLPPCSSSGVHNGLGTWVYLKSLGMLCAEKSGKHFWSLSWVVAVLDPPLNDFLIAVVEKWVLLNSKLHSWVVTVLDPPLNEFLIAIVEK